MLIKHHLIHLTQGPVFPFDNTILGRHIQTRKLVFKTQVMAKGFKMRVSELRAIVTTDRSYGISVPLVLQPQDKISNKTKCLSFLFKKEHPRIIRYKGRVWMGHSSEMQQQVIQALHASPMGGHSSMLVTY
jgi:hypothetical protein